MWHWIETHRQHLHKIEYTHAEQKEIKTTTAEPNNINPLTTCCCGRTNAFESIILPNLHNLFAPPHIIAEISRRTRSPIVIYSVILNGHHVRVLHSTGPHYQRGRCWCCFWCSYFCCCRGRCLFHSIILPVHSKCNNFMVALNRTDKHTQPIMKKEFHCDGAATKAKRCTYRAEMRLWFELIKKFYKSHFHFEFYNISKLELPM